MRNAERRYGKNKLNYLLSNFSNFKICYRWFPCEIYQIGIIYFTRFFTKNKCMTKIENFAGSRKVAHILKVWSLLSTKIPISSRSVENLSVMSHSPAAPPEFTNPAQIFFFKAIIHW
jgi:hypothetical protein